VTAYPDRELSHNKTQWAIAAAKPKHQSELRRLSISELEADKSQASHLRQDLHAAPPHALITCDDVR